MSKKLIGLSIAAAAAVAFASVPATSAIAAAHKTAQVKCVGGNACKGKSACATSQNKCKGHNSCKGKGVVMAKSAKACKKMGGTVEEVKKTDQQ